MAEQLNDISALQTYLHGVVNRADHHADNIREVIYTLIGTVVHFKNPQRPIKVASRQGATANVLWVWIGESRYAFSYDHKSGSVVLKLGSTQGKVLARFTNATKTADIVQFFSGLKSS
jgi:hypothetical protein